MLRDKVIKTAFDSNTKRGERNLDVFGSMDRWMKRAGIKDKEKLARTLAEVRRINPILLFYPGANVSKAELRKLERRNWIVGKLRNKGNWLRRKR